MTKKVKQILLMILVVIVAVIAGGSLYLYMWLNNSVHDTSGILEVQGINDSIEITYDKMGIPQIWAKNEHEGYFAMGYIHASDRMFQMDMARRMSQGRMSELLGEVTLEIDKKQRQIGHNRMAAQTLSGLDESNKLCLQAYADGVNAFKNASGAPQFEYLLLGATFEDWTVLDCLTLLSFQTWYSDALQNHDQFYMELKNIVGEAKAATMCYSYPDWAPVTVPESKKIGQADSITVNQFGAVSPPDEISTFLMSNSSNAWVVGPNKTASGSAILSSDPHLQINQLPQFWYMLGLHIEKTNLNALGITTPGLPFVIMGHNGKAAWAFTAGGIHVTQYYNEQINPDDTNQYKSPDGWKNFEIVTDTIIVFGLDSPIVLNTKITGHGPVLIDSESEGIKSLRWAGFDTDINLAAKSGFDLMAAGDFQSFRKIVTSLGALNANWVYADIDGNIGYQLGTPIPKRKSQNDCFSLPGWTNEFEWSGYYPLEKVPYCFNPSQQWLANSNNLAARNSSFPQVTGSFAADRILRITELMNDHSEISIDDCKQFQFDRTDNYLLRWRWTIAKSLIALGHHELAEAVNNWDGSTALDSKETAIVMAFLIQLRKLAFADEMGDMYKGVRTIWLDEVFHNETLEFWFDDINSAEVESREDISLIAVSNAFEIVGQKKWEVLNNLTMRHPLSNIPILGGLLELDRGNWSWPGTAGTLNASFIVSKNDSTFETIVGPSWRFVIDFADVDAASFVLPAGNSGNPMSPHFFDFNQMWREGEYWNVSISYEKVKIKAVGTLILRPAIETDKD